MSQGEGFSTVSEYHHHHHHHHLFAQYAEMNSKICNVRTERLTVLALTTAHRYRIVTIKTQLQKLKSHVSNRQL